MLKYCLLFCLLLAGSNLVNGKRIAKLTAKRLEKISKSGSVFDSRVINGIDATVGLAPYQISLQSTFGEHMCGGAIVDEHYILTAAHCVYGYNPLYLKVVTGTILWQEPGAKYDVEEFWVHCNYNTPDYHNDIAIIRVTQPIVFNEYTKPVILPDVPLANASKVLLTGWGSTVLFGDTPDVLQQATLTYIDYPSCQEEMGGDDDNGVGHICTLTDEGVGACHGDSGGPLAIDGVLVGLVNWGMPCAIGYPDSFASVHFYRDWIRRTMAESSCKSCHCYASNYD
ncbi:chymotrypsin-2 [Drosophila grimshawi]|uniref:GH14252 n=1 Tax=Drosophila grimshawi TaxID=7222 RepID=B4JY91_DROGR|nr:chymotrypsin-2 [Drosophila grimshawi]EDV90653.1 GH14252 [Drosophila grimshawi]